MDVEVKNDKGQTYLKDHEVKELIKRAKMATKNQGI